MDMHDFLDNVKVQRFCLTLIGEARLWYESLRPINAGWDDLQHMFRQQYREQLFHVWRSFHFDENAQTIDAYVHCIRQIANLLGYQDPQILEVFKNTLPSKLYWVLFPIENLRQMVYTAKRMLTKEKIDKQLVGQSSSTPFMNLRDSHCKKVSFNMKDDLEQKIDKLMVMMDKLVTEDDGHSKPFKPKIYQSGRGRNQNRGSFHGRFRGNTYADVCHTIKILEVDIGITLILEEILVIIIEVARDMGIITMIIEGTALEVKLMIGIEEDC